MKEFFKFMFASMVGFLLSLFIMSFIFMMMMIVAVAAFSSKDIAGVKPNSVLLIQLKEPISERTSNNPLEDFDVFNMKAKRNLGLNDIIKDIDKAKDDDNIKGIYLDLVHIPSGIATIEEVRNALLRFKESGKFIISYSDIYTQGAYYLASVSDKIYMNPEGYFDFKGLNASAMFFKGTLEKLDIEPQIIRGKNNKFKSAVEPFILDAMSEANKEQTKKYVVSIWDHILKGISETRKIEFARLNELADSFKIQTASDALKYKLVDGLLYKDEFLSVLCEKLKEKKNSDINYISLNKYDKASSVKKNTFSKNKIAVIYATGDIVEGEGDNGSIGSVTLSEAIRDVRLDTSIKAIVLRVNSPGGSALASECIWREVMLAEKVKPFVVSMGDVAASGGYYISCAADTIVAEPNTITGSIGVFGILPNMKGFFNNKLGITFDNVKTNEYSDFGSAVRPLKPAEMNILQNEVDRVYDVFMKHVSDGRNMPVASVDSIGQGRVWSGADAKNIGLVDILGGINVAVDVASKMAKLKDYKVVEYPKQKDPFTQIVEELSGGVKVKFVKEELGENYKYYEYLKSLSTMKGVQARMPYLIEVE